MESSARGSPFYILVPSVCAILYFAGVIPIIFENNRIKYD